MQCAGAQPAPVLAGVDLAQGHVQLVEWTADEGREEVPEAVAVDVAGCPVGAEEPPHALARLARADRVEHVARERGGHDLGLALPAAIVTAGAKEAARMLRGDQRARQELNRAAEVRDLEREPLLVRQSRDEQAERTLARLQLAMELERALGVVPDLGMGVDQEPLEVGVEARAGAFR